jgi:hypothetical protein
VVTIAGKKGTIGKYLVNNVLPKNAQDYNATFDSGTTKKILTEIAKNNPQDAPAIMDYLKNVGFNAAYEGGGSVSIEDVAANRLERDTILKTFSDKLNDAKKKYDGDELNKRMGDIILGATDAMQKFTRKNLDSRVNGLGDLLNAGAKGNISNSQQMIASPVAAQDMRGNTIPTLITTGYGEGMRPSDYWAMAHGARKGVVDRAVSTAEPGYLNKALVNTNIDLLVTETDCGTTRGGMMDIDDPEITDRYLAEGGPGYSAGDLVTPALVQRLKGRRIKELKVRNSIYCEASKGICSKCAGQDEYGRLQPVGTAIGIISSQSLSEPSTQMTMKTFHCNSSASIVQCRVYGDERILSMTMEDVFDFVESEIVNDGEEEVKECDNLEVYDGDSWTRVTHVRRHAPFSKMVAVSDGGLVTICQDNHPLAVWENPVACEGCGHNRIKKTSYKRKDGKPNTRGRCPKCGLSQEMQDRTPGEAGFLPPSEIQARSVFLQRDLRPALNAPPVDDYPLDPYFCGLYLAEGSLAFRGNMKSDGTLLKKPYTAVISMYDCPARDRLLERTADMNPRVNGLKNIDYHDVDRGYFILETMGRYSHGKHLPAEFLGYSEEWLLWCLAGIIDGDGTVKSISDGPSQIAIDTCSFAMAQQVVALCAKVGIQAGFCLTSIKELTRNQGFRIHIRMTEHAKGILSDKSFKVDGIESHSSPDQEVDVFGKNLVSFVKPAMYTDDFVYDLTTESSTLFVSGLKSHNTGGAVSASADIASAFDTVKNLLHLPKNMPGKATLSSRAGKVTDVKESALGGYDVFVDDKKHHIEARQSLNVKKGQTVEKGEKLSKGIAHPGDVLNLQGPFKARERLAEELWDVYKSSGQNIKRKHFETVSRGIINSAQVLDNANDEEVVPGDYVSFDWLDAKNRKGVKDVRIDDALGSYLAEQLPGTPQGKILDEDDIERIKREGIKTIRANPTPVDHIPQAKGITMMPLTKRDWMGQMSFSHIREAVQHGVPAGWKSNLHEWNPIPGLVYGAEFAKNKGPTY